MEDGKKLIDYQQILKKKKGNKERFEIKVVKKLKKNLCWRNGSHRERFMENLSRKRRSLYLVADK